MGHLLRSVARRIGIGPMTPLEEIPERVAPGRSPIIAGPVLA
jgi:hypothetical protein